MQAWQVKERHFLLKKSTFCIQRGCQGTVHVVKVPLNVSVVNTDYETRMFDVGL